MEGVERHSYHAGIYDLAGKWKRQLDCPNSQVFFLTRDSPIRRSGRFRIIIGHQNEFFSPRIVDDVVLEDVRRMLELDFEEYDVFRVCDHLFQWNLGRIRIVL